MSRLPVKECVPDAPNPAETVLLLEHLESSPVNVSQIRNRTRRDPLLSRVYRFVVEGWTAQVNQDLLPFSKRKEELSTLDGCLLWGKRVIVPPSLRRSILCELHEGHPRTSKMKCLLFAQFGLPATVVTDNGTQFISEEFEQLMKNNGIKHILSASYHPATNPVGRESSADF